MQTERRWESIAWAITCLLGALVAFMLAVRPGNALLAAGLFFTGIGALVFAVRRTIEFWQPGVLAERDREAWRRRTVELQEAGSYGVVLEFVGARHIDVVKVVREVTGCDPVAAKHFLETPGRPVCVGRSLASCELIVARLEQAGATATIHRGAGAID